MITIRRVITRFERFIDKTDGCWNWTGAKNKEGYGQFTINNRNHRSNRIAYLIYVGDIPEEMNVCHTCDNPSCVNPKHLFLGTRSDNMKDAYKKGRKTNKGSNNPNSKLKEYQVIEIRNKYKSGIKQVDLANEYAVSRHVIFDIVRNKRWKHIN